MCRFKREEYLKQLARDALWSDPVDVPGIEVNARGKYVRAVVYCSVLYCTVLYCTVQYCTVLYCTVLYCTVLYCTALYCTVLI